MVKSEFLMGSLLYALMSSAVFAQIELTPEVVELRDVSQSGTLFVTHNGQPVLPAEITKIVSGVFKYRDDVPDSAEGGTHFSNYSHMFDFKINPDGSISITARDDHIQEGTYDLYVHSIYGKATGSIRASLLESFPSMRRERPKKPEFTYGIVLPDYAHGQQIVIELAPDQVNTYFWYIDGELHSSGLGETSFRALPGVGTHEISFIAKNPAGDVVSFWSDTTVVSK